MLMQSYANTSRTPIGRLTLILATATLAAQAQEAESPWTYTSSAQLRVAFDSNVYMQDKDAPLVTIAGGAGGNVADAEEEAFILAPSLNASIAYKKGSYKADLSYAPEAQFFEGVDSEDHTLHRFTANASGTSAGVPWDVKSSFTYIDGSEEGLQFVRRGGVPSIGSPVIRDRREQWVARMSARTTHAFGEKVVVRPLFSAYEHEFLTRKRSASGRYTGYQNYADRSEYLLGADIGLKAKPGLVFLGYRHGWQFQEKLGVAGFDSDYGSTFHRVLVGLEATLTPWLRIAGSAGPDFRDFDDQVAAGFDTSQTVPFADVSATLTLSKADTVVLTWRHFMQPAFGGRSVYEDITYDAVYRRTFSKSLSGNLGFRAYRGEFQPVLRDDWIYTVSAGLGYSLSAKTRLEGSYLYDWAVSDVSQTEGREYERHLLSLSVRQSF